MTGFQGDLQDEKVGTGGVAVVEQDPGQGDRDDKQGDQEQVGGKTPHRLVNMFFPAVFYDHDVKLAGEEHHRHHGHEGQRKPLRIGDLLGIEHEQLVPFRETGQKLRKDVGETVEQAVGDKEADHQEGHDLEQ